MQWNHIARGYELHKLKQKIHNDYIKDKQDCEVIKSYITQRNTKIKYSIAEKIAKSIVKQSRECDVPQELIIGIIEKESMFKPDAISNKNARGLMQVLRGDIVIDRTKTTNIDYNIEMGTSIFLKKMQYANGDVSLALEKYSGGAKNYSENVLTNAGRFVIYKKIAKRNITVALLD